MTDESTRGGIETVQLVTFDVGGGEYALPISGVKEIINPLPIRPVPRAPAFVEGVVELRGAILPVVDLRKRFGVEVTPRTRATKYLIITLRGRIVGLVVDRVLEVLRVARPDIRETPSMRDSRAAHFFAGMCHHKGHILLLLDIERILGTEEAIPLEVER